MSVLGALQVVSLLRAQHGLGRDIPKSEAGGSGVRFSPRVELRLHVLSAGRLNRG